MKTSKLINIFRRGQNKAVPLSYALRKCLPRKIYQQIINECPDRRQYSEYTASLLGATEEAVQKQVANYLGLPFHQRVSAIEVHRLPANCSLELFRRSGSIPILSDDSIEALVCVDPELAFKTLKTDFNQIYLSSWAAISRALSESERSYHEQSSAPSSINTDTNILTQIIDKLTAEAARFDSNEVSIEIKEDEILYTIIDSAENYPKGNINPKCSSILEHALSNQEFIKDYNPLLSVEKLQNRYVLKISQSISEDNLAKPEDAAIAKEDDSPTQSNAPQVASNPPLEKVTEPSPDGTNSLILVIDDNPVFGQVLERFFARQSLQSQIESDSTVALAQIQAGTLKPGLVVCDLHMPNMNGISFCQQLRDIPAFKNTPLIMLTSEEDIETEIDALHQGVSLFLRKSQDPRILCAHVSRLIAEEEHRKAA